MSYCRWSSDNFKCDIYAYESDNGYQIHVASNKIVGKIPKQDWGLLQSGDKKDMQQYIRNEQKRNDWLDSAKRVPINGPVDGESFTFTDLVEFYEAMIVLRGVGYNIPDNVFLIIEDEMTEMMAELDTYKLNNL